MNECIAELILFNGRVRTLDAALPFATALAVWKGRLLALGSDDDILGLRGAGTQTVDLRGRTVLPGFTDCHIHFAWWAQRRRQIALADARSPEEAVRRVAERVASAPHGSWILGGGFDRNSWPGAAWPTCQMLDVVAPAHPVLLSSKDYHSIWVNTLALRMGGVTAETPDTRDGAHPAGREQRRADRHPLRVRR